MKLFHKTSGGSFSQLFQKFIPDYYSNIYKSIWYVFLYYIQINIPRFLCLITLLERLFLYHFAHLKYLLVRFCYFRMSIFIICCFRLDIG